MKVLWVTVILVLSQYQVLADDACCEEYCFGTDNERVQTRHFTSKTAYQIAKGTGLDKHVNITNCTPTKIWLLSRHGTRLPSAKTIKRASDLEEMRDQIDDNYKVRRSKPDTGALCQEDLFSIKLWKFNSSITPEMDNFLTAQGWEDLKLMAKTYQRLYPNILTKEYNAQNFLFRHTGIQRTEESYKAFVDGLFGTNAYQNIHVVQPSGNDTLLRPYDYCPIWEENNKKNDNDTEFQRFKNSALMQKTIYNISRRLGYEFPLDMSEVELIWDMCRYEQAWNLDRSSAWCAAFTPEQLNVLEYYDDLRYYKKSGYGHEINSRIPCELIKDMLQQLNSKTQPNVIAYFAHSTMIQTILTAMGIKNDSTEPTSQNYGSMKDRKWKTSVLDPFASNLMAVKYDCPADPSDTQKVQFFLNQNLVTDLEWCKVGLCDWSAVMKQYNNFYNADCKEYYCRTGGASVASVSLLSLLIAAIIYLIY